LPHATPGEGAPSHSLKTHLAFGDAQTVAMLDPAVIADKEVQPLHRTEMSGLWRLSGQYGLFMWITGPVISDRAGEHDKSGHI
jgi:hypothetical protein